MQDRAAPAGLGLAFWMGGASARTSAPQGLAGALGRAAPGGRKPGARKARSVREPAGPRCGPAGDTGARYLFSSFRAQPQACTGGKGAGGMGCALGAGHPPEGRRPWGGPQARPKIGAAGPIWNRQKKRAASRFAARCSFLDSVDNGAHPVGAKTVYHVYGGLSSSGRNLSCAPGLPPGSAAPFLGVALPARCAHPRGALPPLGAGGGWGSFFPLDGFLLSLAARLSHFGP